MEHLKNQLCRHIEDLLCSEQQIHRILPKLANRTDDPRLKTLVEKNLNSNEEHINRLKLICKNLKIVSGGTICSDIKFLIGDIQEYLDSKEAQNPSPEIINNYIQRLLHLEISAYTNAIRGAENLEWGEVANLLQKSLDEKHNQEIEMFISL